MLIVWFVMRGNPRIDYRIVAIASILPDVIDKPIGRILLRDRFESGRLFGHTLLLNLALFCVLFFMRGRFKRTFVLVPTSMLMHLAEDAMWAQPRTFWWPLFGTTFPTDTTGGFLGIHWRVALIQEAIGLAVLLWLFAAHGMISRDGMAAFLRTGRLVQPEQEART